MAVSNSRLMRDGGDIMLFYYDGTSYTSIAHGTSHQLSLNAETEDINTKDAGKFGMTEVSRITWEITADHMYTRDGFNTFYSYMMGDPSKGENKLTVVFGEKDYVSPGTDDVNISADGNWLPDSESAYAYVYSGVAVISSLSVDATNGQKATISVTLNGQASFSPGLPTA